MKNNLLIIAALFAVQLSFSQAPLSVAKSLPVSYNDVEVRPEYPGGYKEFLNYVAKNFRSPDVEGLAGVIKLSFIIETNGKITDIKILQDIGHGAGEEAKRVVSTSPLWIPGEQNGKLARVEFVLPINIKGY
jgi:Gram-negative bacterial TonB protein C-terminal